LKIANSLFSIGFITVVICFGAAGSHGSQEITPGLIGGNEENAGGAGASQAVVANDAEISFLLKKIGMSQGRNAAEAPDFNLLDLNGKPVVLSHYRGSVVLLGFWTTW
jgi:hypothetical protein